tara:strand:- start:92 stop:544 length:453 start_codon:yes stop_codon:yes gene_type:complete
MNIDLILKNLELDDNIKKYGILLASIMFFWSGQNKIFNFNKKVETLMKKTNLNNIICNIGMILVILLEIIGFLFLVEYYFNIDILYKLFDKINVFIYLSQKQVVQIILLLLLLFIIVVTIIYHPPSFEHPIPFFSNLTMFGLFLYVYSDL